MYKCIIRNPFLYQDHTCSAIIMICSGHNSHNRRNITLCCRHSSSRRSFSMADRAAADAPAATGYCLGFLRRAASYGRHVQRRGRRGAASMFGAVSHRRDGAFRRRQGGELLCSISCRRCWGHWTTSDAQRRRDAQQLA